MNAIKKSIHDLFYYPEKSKSYNIEYHALHGIFKDMDLLHIIGGGYINSFWPDMLYEVLIAARLAKKYQKKYCITGISVHPTPDKYQEEIREIFDGAEFADFRDDSYLTCGINVGSNILGTTDDVVDMEDYYPNNISNEYATIAFHGWREKNDAILQMLENNVVPFMLKCLEKKHVQFFYVMGFSYGDIKFWKSLIDSNPKLNKSTKYIECTANDAVYSKHIVSNAKFNIGSRFHQAVFSLANHVPVLSISVDDYYENKLKNIHRQFCSEEIYSLNEITELKLTEFVNRLHDIRTLLISSEETINDLLNKKNMNLAAVYGIDSYEAKNRLMMPKEPQHQDPNENVMLLKKRIKAMETVIKENENELKKIKRDAQKDKKQNEKKILKLEEKFYNSTTWKTGNLILCIPKKVKKFLHKVNDN